MERPARIPRATSRNSIANPPCFRKINIGMTVHKHPWRPAYHLEAIPVPRPSGSWDILDGLSKAHGAGETEARPKGNTRQAIDFAGTHRSATGRDRGCTYSTKSVG